jgi:hypothetical protein
MDPNGPPVKSGSASAITSEIYEDQAAPLHRRVLQAHHRLALALAPAGGWEAAR